jgi:hypothetical protein
MVMSTIVGALLYDNTVPVVHHPPHERYHPAVVSYP